jgi:hypothetical protein
MDDNTDFETDEQYPLGMDDCPPDDYDGYEHYEDLHDFEPIPSRRGWQD